jgi:hypothetical protein
MATANQKRKETVVPRLAFDVAEIGIATGMHTETVLHKLKTGEIRGYRLSPRGKWRVSRNELSRLVGCEPEELPV